MNYVFVDVDGARVAHPVPVPLTLMCGVVDEEYAVYMVGDVGEGVSVDVLWVGCDYVVCVRVDVGMFE